MTANLKLTSAAQATGEYTFTITKNGLRKGATSDVLTGIIRKVHLFVDQEIKATQDAYPEKVACKAGCSYCCHQAIHATAPEILAIFETVRSFPEADQTALKERIASFLKALPLEPLTLPACPLLVNNLCSVYEARPFSCRMTSSFDAEVCREVCETPERARTVSGLNDQTSIGYFGMQALLGALHQSGVNAGLYNVAQALDALFENPELGEQVPAGKAEFPADPQLSGSKFFPTDETPAHGRGTQDPAAAEGQAMMHQGRVDRADAILNEGVPAQMLAKLRLPEVYSSQQQLLTLRSRYEQVLDRLVNARFDPTTCYNELENHQTFLLAYQALSVKDTLSKHGKWVCDVAARALPHLAAPIEGPRRPGKLRVGYLSRNLNNSNGGKWALGWLENHCEDIETYAFPIGENRDSVTALFRHFADHFYHLSGNAQGAAEFVRSLDLDVLIFTDLGMDGRNYQFAGLRLARTQCTAWGHPVTSGLPTIDYYLSSEFMEPEDADEEYTEKLVRLPRSGLCYRYVKPNHSNRIREEFGLRSEPYFFMGQNISKWVPKRDAIFQKIHERSRKPIVIMGQNPMMRERLSKLDVPFAFVPQVTPYEYDRIMQLAEVSIDPPDWSGGNTSITALTLGVPVATWPGEYMRGRHTYAFHRIAGTEGLIAKDEDDFVDLIVNKERHRSAMRGAHPEALYDDKGVVEALDGFLLGLK